MPPAEPARVVRSPQPKASSTAGWLGALERTSRIGTDQRRILPRVIEALAPERGAEPALIGARETLSYDELAARANRYARWALAQGLGPGDTVCLLMRNEPDYMAIWLGLTHAGATVALLNTNLIGASLAHCIDVVSPRAALVAAELLDAFDSARPFLAASPRLWVHGESGRDDPRIDSAIASYNGSSLAEGEAPPVTLADRALCIYTSGTTGLPKAANVSHHRLVTWTHWFSGLMDVQPNDRMYECLPMYHSIGGVVAPGSVLVGGGSVVIREKFSAHAFWQDVAASDCTLFQYIGELCRYLVQSPPNPHERAHRLRLAVGNGLRAEVWESFQSRFRIPRILEFYAATESTVSLYNVEGKVGAVGRVPPFMAHRSRAAIVKFDVESGTPIRGSDGLCIRVARNEVGELIGRLSAAKAEHRFEGYTDRAESDRKILRDVFEAGDAWLRTGDLMRIDENGFFYFVDRAGDTFRWKGENVATIEVTEVVGSAPGVEEAVVYGVAIPGIEGRAGMAAIRIRPDFDLARFRAHVAARLPAYARPLFLRLLGKLDVTDTFKPKKHALVEEGFDPAHIADPLFFDDIGQGAYVTLDPELYRKLVAGDVRL
jgi:fatty-acyl-CoA synthase